MARFIAALINGPPSSAPHTDFLTFYDHVLAQVAGVMAAAEERGEVSPGPADARLLVLMGAIGEAVHGHLLVGRPELTPALADTLVELLPDRHVIRVVDQPSLLMHGDLLCIDDVDYLRARRRFRNPLFQWLMLRKPLPERRRIAADYRRRSGEETALKPAEIMDVNPAAVVRELQRHRVRQLIHGHTHRAAIHRLTLPDGSQAKRIVLPEWHSDRAAALADDGSRLQEVQIVRD